jgi:hypothetical protein
MKEPPSETGSAPAAGREGPSHGESPAPLKSGRAHDLDPVPPGWRSGSESGGERLLRAAFDNVQQPGRACAGTDRGQVDGDADVPVARAGVTPPV